MARSTVPSTSAEEAAPGGRRGLPGALGDLDWRRYVIYIGFVVIFVLFAVTLGDSGFLSTNNLLNILRQTAIITVIAVGMTFVISCAEIDLSVGSVAGLSSVCTAMALSRFGILAGILAGLAVGLVVGAVILAKTRFGRQVLATGGNRIAAEYTGVNTRRIKFSVLLVCSLCAAVAGMLYAGRLQSGRFQWGAGDELSAIAAVILGGTSLFGGSGTIVGTLFGALLIGLVNNGLILAGLDVSQQQVVRGAIIILAVALARRK